MKHGIVCKDIDCIKRYLGVINLEAGKFWNVVLEKDGEDKLDRSCE